MNTQEWQARTIMVFFSSFLNLKFLTSRMSVMMSEMSTITSATWINCGLSANNPMLIMIKLVLLRMVAFPTCPPVVCREDNSRNLVLLYDMAKV